MTLPELEPLYTEVEAAKKLGIEFKWLRAERYAGRIGWKKVAGRVMYRHQDLVDWHKRGIDPCQEEDQATDRNFGSIKHRDEGRSTTSSGRMEDGNASVQRALAAAEKLIRSSRGGSSTAKTSKPDSLPAPVIQLKRE